MKNILLMPDSFKGSMNSSDVADIMEKAIHDIEPSVHIRKFPMSDGGEGFLKFYQNTHPNSIMKTIEVSDELMEKLNVNYIIDGKTAVVESAKIIGLPKAMGSVMERSSYGLGELIRELNQNEHISEIVISVGGTSTIDMGLGALSALGVIFLDGNRNEVFPIPKNINKISAVDQSSLIKTKKILILSDVTNTLFGKESGILEYSPQKGANSEEIKELYYHYKNIISEEEDQKYFGSGGGISASLVKFMDAEIMSGMDFVLKKINFSLLLKDTDYVFTGEGSIDSQSFQGKVLGKIYEKCSSQSVPVFAFAGEINENVTKDNLFCIPIHLNKKAYDNYKENSVSNLFLATQNTMRLLLLNN